MFGSGPGDWEYTLIDSSYKEEDIKEHLRYLENYDWSEHFRGYEWEYVDVPSKKFLEREISSVKYRIKSNQDYLKILEEINGE